MVEIGPDFPLFWYVLCEFLLTEGSLRDISILQLLRPIMYIITDFWVDQIDDHDEIFPASHRYNAIKMKSVIPNKDLTRSKLPIWK